MLTIRQNFLETIHGGSPDRFVNQYEYMEIISSPISSHCSDSCEPGEIRVNDWGATIFWPEGEPGPFPVHDRDHIRLKDITQWKKIIERPDPAGYPEEEWAPVIASAHSVDRREKFVAALIAPGIFEKMHMLMGMENALTSFLVEPEAVHEFIDFLTAWEIDAAKEEIRRYHPDLLFHHDDWGSQTRLFFSPETFQEFFLPAYKKIYGFWKSNGVEIIVHHSDSYAAEFVPYMIEMGVDVFQGAVSENNIPELIRKHGGKISVHGGLDNGKFDKADWSAEAISAELDGLFTASGARYLIPGFTMGSPGSSYPGAYEAASAVIDSLSPKYFS